MEFFKGIIPFTDRSKIASEIGDSTQLMALYDLIRTNKDITDNQAQQVLYGQGQNDGAYKKLKQRLREKIQEYITKHGIPNKNVDNYSILYRKCMQQVFAVKTLILSNARPAASYIAENLIKTTIKNEYTDLSMILASELGYYYSTISFSPRKSQKYYNLLNELRDLYGREQIATMHYCELRMAFRSSRALMKDKWLPKAKSHAEEVSGFLSHKRLSYQLVLMSYLVIAMRYELAGDYINLLKICNEAIDAFKNRKITRNVAYYLFDVRRIICYIQQKSFTKAEQIAGLYFPKMNTQDMNWFVLKAYVMLSRLQDRNYNGAYMIMREVRSNKAYRSLPSTTAQTWYIFEAHIYFLLSIGKIDSTTYTEPKFKVYKFLNNIPIYSKDKRGLNVAVLIMHVLILLQQSKYGDIIDRVDALNQYCHRHLRRDETFRSNCFIKMLLKAVKADFNRKRTERYTENLYHKLLNTPFVISDQNIEVEIIPYEELWLMALELLQ